MLVNAKVYLCTLSLTKNTCNLEPNLIKLTRKAKGTQCGNVNAVSKESKEGGCKLLGRYSDLTWFTTKG